ncbi:MAG: translation initiation factor IF-2, partial [Bacteroidales bacterium]
EQLKDKEEEEEPKKESKKEVDVKVVGKVDLDSISGKKKKEEGKATKEEPKEEKEEKEEKPATKETVTQKKEEPKEKKKDEDVKIVGKIDLEDNKKKKKEEEKAEAEEKQEKEKKVEEVEEPKEEAPEDKEAEEKPKEKDKDEIPTVFKKLSGPTVVGKIDLPKEKEAKKKPVASSSEPDKAADKKRKRKRIRKDTERVDLKGNKQEGKKDRGKKKKKLHRPEVDDEEVQKQIKDTLAKLTSKGKSKGSKYRREKRDTIHQKMQAELEKQAEDKNTLKVTEFVSVSELANMMNVPVNEVIQTCMNLGLFVSINQRLDAETLVLVADEFNYKVEFVSADLQDSFEEEEQEGEDNEPRPPIVTVMGHVDHGKTKLLDHIRSANVIAGEAGGITQHIGAYGVELEDGRKITFLDTPGHEAFTAMRARGAQITDVAIIVVAADDGVKPQTVEAINHASAAGVPIVFAVNKIDKSTANPDKVKEELANMNYLVEDWGGKYQSQDISAKNGIAIDDLLEKVLLEAEMLELKSTSEKKATGTVIESTLDRGRGYVATVLVQNGTLNMGDILLAGSHYGHVKAMYNERGQRVDEAGPSTPVLILGLNGAPQAGDRFNVMENDREAKDYATRREQLQREQELRTQKHITLDEIGRRIAIGNFKELNLIVKGDVDGSVEALSDSLLKLSTEEIQVNIKHKAVGQITESDILLAAASNAIVIGFQVRPSVAARKIAEREQIDIRLYSIIYDAIEEIKAAMEGMLSPEIKEEIVATLEVLETFKITKVGTIAGCMVKEGKIRRDSKVRVIRDGIVVYTGELGSLKRFKDEVKEVVTGLECGLNIENFNDIKVGDLIEAYTEVEVKKTL